jgi:hypothetical protein
LAAGLGTDNGQGREKTSKSFYLETPLKTPSKTKEEIEALQVPLGDNVPTEVDSKEGGDLDMAA